MASTAVKEVGNNSTHKVLRRCTSPETLDSMGAAELRRFVVNLENKIKAAQDELAEAEERVMRFEMEEKGTLFHCIRDLCHMVVIMQQQLMQYQQYHPVAGPGGHGQPFLGGGMLSGGGVLNGLLAKPPPSPGGPTKGSLGGRKGRGSSLAARGGLKAAVAASVRMRSKSSAFAAASTVPPTPPQQKPSATAGPSIMTGLHSGQVSPEGGARRRSTKTGSTVITNPALSKEVATHRETAQRMQSVYEDYITLLLDQERQDRELQEVKKREAQQAAAAAAATADADVEEQKKQKKKTAAAAGGSRASIIKTPNSSSSRDSGPNKRPSSGVDDQKDGWRVKPSVIKNIAKVMESEQGQTLMSDRAKCVLLKIQIEENDKKQLESRAKLNRVFRKIMRNFFGRGPESANVKSLPLPGSSGGSSDRPQQHTVFKGPPSMKSVLNTLKQDIKAQQADNTMFMEQVQDELAPKIRHTVAMAAASAVEANASVSARRKSRKGSHKAGLQSTNKNESAAAETADKTGDQDTVEKSSAESLASAAQKQQVSRENKEAKREIKDETKDDETTPFSNYHEESSDSTTIATATVVDLIHALPPVKGTTTSAVTEMSTNPPPPLSHQLPSDSTADDDDDGHHGSGMRIQRPSAIPSGGSAFDIFTSPTGRRNTAVTDLLRQLGELTTFLYATQLCRSGGSMTMAAAGADQKEMSADGSDAMNNDADGELSYDGGVNKFSKSSAETAEPIYRHPSDVSNLNVIDILDTAFPTSMPAGSLGLREKLLSLDATGIATQFHNVSEVGTTKNGALFEQNIAQSANQDLGLVLQSSARFISNTLLPLLTYQHRANCLGGEMGGCVGMLSALPIKSSSLSSPSDAAKVQESEGNRETGGDNQHQSDVPAAQADTPPTSEVPPPTPKEGEKEQSSQQRVVGPEPGKGELQQYHFHHHLHYHVFNNTNSVYGSNFGSFFAFPQLRRLIHAMLNVNVYEKQFKTRLHFLINYGTVNLRSGAPVDFSTFYTPSSAISRGFTMTTNDLITSTTKTLTATRAISGSGQYQQEQPNRSRPHFGRKSIRSNERRSSNKNRDTLHNLLYFFKETYGLPAKEMDTVKSIAERYVKLRQQHVKRLLLFAGKSHSLFSFSATNTFRRSRKSDDKCNVVGDPADGIVSGVIPAVATDADSKPVCDHNHCWRCQLPVACEDCSRLEEAGGRYPPSGVFAARSPGDALSNSDSDSDWRRVPPSLEVLWRRIALKEVHDRSSDAYIAAEDNLSSLDAAEITPAILYRWLMERRRGDILEFTQQRLEHFDALIGILNELYVFVQRNRLLPPSVAVASGLSPVVEKSESHPLREDKEKRKKQEMNYRSLVATAAQFNSSSGNDDDDSTQISCRVWNPFDAINVVIRGQAVSSAAAACGLLPRQMSQALDAVTVSNNKTEGNPNFDAADVDIVSDLQQRRAHSSKEVIQRRRSDMLERLPPLISAGFYMNLRLQHENQVERERLMYCRLLDFDRQLNLTSAVRGSDAAGPNAKRKQREKSVKF